MKLTEEKQKCIQKSHKADDTNFHCKSFLCQCSHNQNTSHQHEAHKIHFFPSVFQEELHFFAHTSVT